MTKQRTKTEAEERLAEGDFQAAITLLAPVALEHEDPELWNTLGTAYARSFEDDRALSAYRASAALDPCSHKPHANTATVLARRGDHAGACRALREATRLAPSNVRLLLRLAQQAQLAELVDEEVATYERVLTLEPTQSHRNLLARALIQAGRFNDALHRLEQGDSEPDEDAISLELQAKLGQRPSPPLHGSLARVLAQASAPHTLMLAEIARERGELAVAEQLARRALELSPGDQQALRCAALAMAAQGNTERAIELLETLGLDNANESVLNTWLDLAKHGSRPQRMGRLLRAMELRPKDTTILLALARTTADQDEEQAFDYLERALAISPSDAATHGERGAMLAQRGELSAAQAWLRRADELSSTGSPPSALWFVELHDANTSHNRLYEATRAAMLEHEFAAQAPRKLNANGNRRLRIGYVSGDLRSHAVEKFVRPLLTQYDRERFEVFGYRTTTAADSTTERLGTHVTMRVLAGLDRAAGARLIADDQIDVLVDLSGHTAHGGLHYFSPRPAPVQVSLLGYPATTGLSAIDLRITDAYADPPPLTESFHTETLVRVEPCGWTFAGSAPAPQARPPGVPVVFGSLNRAMKLSGEVLDAWAEILLATPNAHLYIKGRAFWSERARARIFDRMKAHGVGRERLLIVGWTATYEAHQATWQNIDIALDSFPYAGTTTTCEALMMGVPVVSRVGEAHVSRVGASLLAAIGLEDLAAKDWSEYVAKAVALAGDEPRRAKLRSELPKRFASSPLGDPEFFVKGVERIYLEAWSAFARSSELELYGRATRLERSPMTWIARPMSGGAHRTVRRAARFDPAIRALIALARANEPLTTDLPEHVDDLQALSQGRALVLVGEHEPLVVDCLRASIASAEFTVEARGMGSLVFGSERLVDACATDPELLAIVQGTRNLLPAHLVFARVLPELDVLEEVEDGSPAHLVLGRARAAALRAVGRLSTGAVDVTSLSLPATAGASPSLAHLSWFGSAPLAVPPSVSQYLSAISAPLGERVARARSACGAAECEFAQDPSSFTALSLARIALGSGNFTLATTALQAAMANADAACTPQNAFLCAHPRYEVACQSQAAATAGWAGPSKTSMSVFAHDPLWPERLEEQEARAAVDARLRVAAVPRWIVQQAAECLLLYCELDAEKRAELLTSYRRHGGRSLAISRLAAANRIQG